TRAERRSRRDLPSAQTPLPRELATFTWCLAALNPWVNVVPISPTPRMPIFILNLLLVLYYSLGCRMRERFERATKVLHAPVGESRHPLAIACRLGGVVARSGARAVH